MSTSTYYGRISTKNPIPLFSMNSLLGVYFILFKKEYPRLSVAAKKMISKVGHWYLDEHTTYIRVFGATRSTIFSPFSHPIPAHCGINLLSRLSYRAITPH
jgi:hypothetical protein